VEGIVGCWRRVGKQRCGGEHIGTTGALTHTDERDLVLQLHGRFPVSWPTSFIPFKSAYVLKKLRALFRWSRALKLIGAPPG
jgi:hypothetical protein